MKAMMMKNLCVAAAPAVGAKVRLSLPAPRPAMPAAMASPENWEEFEREWSAKWDDRLGNSRPLLRRLADKRE